MMRSHQVALFLSLLVVVFCSHCCILASADECLVDPNWNRPFLVALLADPQIGWNKDEYDSEDLFREAATHVERLQPDILLVAGDLIQTPSNNDQYDTCKSILDGMGIPYYAIPGNHDVRSTPRLELMDEFVDWWNLPYYWYTVPHFNTLFVMMDSNVLRNRDEDDVDSEIVDLAREEMNWLETTLRDEAWKYDHVVPIAHHPLATRRMDEDFKSTNLPEDLREDLMDIYERHPDKISHVFAGHYHTSGRIDTGGIDYVTYPATGVILGSSPREPSGFALLTVEGSNFEEEYYGYDDMPDSRPEASNPGFTITSPPGGSTLEGGSQVCIQWTSTSMAKRVELDYSLDNGNTWDSIGRTSNWGVFSWTVPSDARASNEVRIRITSRHDSGVSTISDQSYRIGFPPTDSPTKRPTHSPTRSPTKPPTELPTPLPTPNPTTGAPTQSPTDDDLEEIESGLEEGAVETIVPTQGETPGETLAGTMTETMVET